jgi:hypothetical protein
LVGAAGVGACFLTGWSEDGLRLAGMLLGAGVGLIWERRAVRFTAAGGRKQRVRRAVLGGALIAALYLALSFALAEVAPAELGRIARYAIVGWAGIGLWPWVCARIGLAEREPAGQPSTA